MVIYQSNPVRVKSSQYHPDIYETESLEDFRRDYTEPRKRAALREYRTGTHRTNVFSKGDN